MNRLLGVAIAAILLVPATARALDTDRLSGDYVEVRTASVFAGACHYGGEVTTTGREALLAWHVRSGTWSGVSLNGLSAMAAVVSDSSLEDDTAARRCVIYVDDKATGAQTKALAGALISTYGKALGQVVAVRTTGVTYRQDGEHFQARVDGVGRLVVGAMPNHECCKQPNLVWYNPLVPVADRRVGFTQASSVHEPALQSDWAKDGQNTAFYGRFAAGAGSH